MFCNLLANLRPSIWKMGGHAGTLTTGKEVTCRASVLFLLPETDTHTTSDDDNNWHLPLFSVKRVWRPVCYRLRIQQDKWPAARWKTTRCSLPHQPQAAWGCLANFPRSGWSFLKAPNEKWCARFNTATVIDAVIKSSTKVRLVR